MTIQDLDEKINKRWYTKLVKVATRQKLKKKKVFGMDTRMMEQFEIMDTEILDHIEGGDVSDIYRGYAYQGSPFGSYPSILKKIQVLFQ